MSDRPPNSRAVTEDVIRKQIADHASTASNFAEEAADQWVKACVDDAAVAAQISTAHANAALALDRVLADPDTPHRTLERVAEGLLDEDESA
jgi:hypothetical protein